MNELLFELDELSGRALEQIATLKAVDAAFRDSHEKIDNVAFLLPVNSLDRTLHEVSQTVQALFNVCRGEVSA